MLKVLLGVLLMAVPVVASAQTRLDLDIEQLTRLKDEAKLVCSVAFAGKSAVEGINAEAYRRGYSHEERLVMLALCMSYGNGYIDGLRASQRL